MGILVVASLRIWNASTMEAQLKQRTQLKLITADLELDMTRDQVLEIVNKHKWPLKRVSEQKDEIWLWTQPQVLATDWKVRFVLQV